MANDSEGYDIKDEDGMPLYVLGKGGKPITADYDLLVTCPHYQELDPGKSDKTPFNTQGRGPRDSKLNIMKVMEAEAGGSSIGMKREVRAESFTLSKTRLDELLRGFPDRMVRAEPIEGGYDISWTEGDETVHVLALANETKTEYTLADETGKPLAENLITTSKEEPKSGTVDPRTMRLIDTVYTKIMRAMPFTLSKTRFEELLRGFPDKMVSVEPIEGGYDISWTEEGETVHVLALANEKETEYILADQERKPLAESFITTPKEDPKMGNVSPRTMTLIDTINTKINRGIGLETVHHNAEFYNPFADDLENHIPALFVFPKSMDLSRIPGLSDGSAPGSLTHVDVVLIESVKEMFAIRKYMKEEGYSWSSHAKYVGYLPAFSTEVKGASEDAIEYAIARTRTFKAASQRPEGNATPDSVDSDSVDEDEENRADDSYHPRST